MDFQNCPMELRSDEEPSGQVGSPDMAAMGREPGPKSEFDFLARLKNREN